MNESSSKCTDECQPQQPSPALTLIIQELEEIVSFTNDQSYRLTEMLDRTRPSDPKKEGTEEPSSIENNHIPMLQDLIIKQRDAVRSIEGKINELEEIL